MRNMHKEMIGQKYGRLTVLDTFINDTNDIIYCKTKCECNNFKDVYYYSLISGATSSCNCYNDEIRKINIKKATEARTQFEPRISSAKRVYESYSDGDLTFEQFLDLTQKDCNYCGVKPSNKRNSAGSKSSEHFKKNADFIYNGLDRVNNDLPHDFNNVVPCCSNCNTMKTNKTLTEFLEQNTKRYLYLKAKGLIF